VLPFDPRFTSKKVGRSRRERERRAPPPGICFPAQAEGAGRHQRKADHVAEDRAILVPADRRPRLIFRHENVLQVAGPQLCEGRRLPAHRLEKARNVVRLLQTAAAEIVPPAEGDDSAFSKETVELEWSELQMPEMMEQALFLRVRDQFPHIAKPRGNFDAVSKSSACSMGASAECSRPSCAAAASRGPRLQFQLWRGSISNGGRTSSRDF
jgi:hypothetical protein